MSKTRISEPERQLPESGARAVPRPGESPARKSPAREAPARSSARPSAVGGNGRPGSPDEMRDEIDRTRARMSRTLDQLEDELGRQKEEIWAKATLQGARRKLSREPWRSVAIAFVAGYIVAALRD